MWISWQSSWQSSTVAVLRFVWRTETFLQLPFLGILNSFKKPGVTWQRVLQLWRLGRITGLSEWFQNLVLSRGFWSLRPVLSFNLAEVCKHSCWKAPTDSEHGLPSFWAQEKSSTLQFSQSGPTVQWTWRSMLLPTTERQLAMSGDRAREVDYALIPAAAGSFHSFTRRNLQSGKAKTDNTHLSKVLSKGPKAERCHGNVEGAWWVPTATSFTKVCEFSQNHYIFILFNQHLFNFDLALSDMDG